MENKFYDKQLAAIIRLLENDYAGKALPNALTAEDFRYYIQACGQAWKEHRLDALTQLRYVSQLLAVTGDRTLRLSLRTEGYTPWHAGIDVRRFGDDLYVTAVQGDDRFRPGDRLVQLNGTPAGLHRRGFQRNFLYADEPERELWGNVMKSVTHVLAEHVNGSREDLPLRRFTAPRLVPETALTQCGDALLLTVGAPGDGEALRQLTEAHADALRQADRLIIDLRHSAGGEDDALLPLMPWILNAPKTMNEADGVHHLRTLYTRANAARRLAVLTPYAGDPDADALMTEIRAKAGAGWIDEELTLWDDLPEVIRPAGHEVILLTDTWTEGPAEAFALLAKKEGRATLLGRATMGTLDMTGTLSVAVSDEFTLAYPTSVSLDALDGNGFMRRGVQPDRTIPFTP